MKIIEALKELKLIEKKIDKNIMEITQYASILNIERPIFESEADQRREIEIRIQSNRDLMNRYLWLKRCIEHTNLVSSIELDGVTYSLIDLLYIKRKMGGKMVSTYSALNTSAADNRIRSGRIAMPTDGRQVNTVMLYDEKKKNIGLSEWQNLVDKIDSRLEVLNATIDLIEI